LLAQDKIFTRAKIRIKKIAIFK